MFALLFLDPRHVLFVFVRIVCKDYLMFTYRLCLLFLRLQAVNIDSTSLAVLKPSKGFILLRVRFISPVSCSRARKCEISRITLHANQC